MIERVDLYRVVRVEAHRDNIAQTFTVYLFYNKGGDEDLPKTVLVDKELTFATEMGFRGFVHGIGQIINKVFRPVVEGNLKMIFQAD